MTEAPAAPHRIAAIKLDSESIGARSTELEIERHRAISDLLESNSFRLKEPADAEGPYRLLLTLNGDRMVIAVSCDKTGHEAEMPLPLSGFRSIIRDYTIVCDNFYKTARAGEIHRLEAIDHGRRSIHDEGAEKLIETLENHVILDKLTARRLFTLLYVLHMRGTTNII